MAQFMRYQVARHVHLWTLSREPNSTVSCMNRSIPAQPRVLIADDQVDVLEALNLLLKAEGFRIETAEAPSEIIKKLEQREYDVLLMDLNYTRDTTSGEEGLDLLGRIQSLDASLPVIVMTAWGSVDLAVEALRRGAKDFIQKPWDNERLFAIVRTQLELGQALRLGQRLEADNVSKRRTNCCVGIRNRSPNC